jgi:hypothetical protein
MTKHGLGYILGDFLTSSSGRPAPFALWQKRTWLSPTSKRNKRHLQYTSNMYIRKYLPRSQSYDFWIYNYNASVVVGKSFFTPDENNFYSKNVLS